MDLAQEPSVAHPDLQTRSSNSRWSSKDSSATVTRLTDLLKGQQLLSTTEQIEIWVKLLASLRKTRALVDPLKLLFQLILRKASSIPVYVLVVVGEFYEDFGKFKEALEVYTAAAKKLDHLDVRLKYWVYRQIGRCLGRLSLEEEAFEWFHKAYSGPVYPQGKRCSQAIDDIIWAGATRAGMSQPTVMLSLCDRLCEGQDSVPDLSIEQEICQQRLRIHAHEDLGDHCKAAHFKERLRVTLTQYYEAHANDDPMESKVMSYSGYAHVSFNYFETALKYFLLEIEVIQDSHEPEIIDLHRARRNAAGVYDRLGQSHRAKELLENLYVEDQRIFGHEHRSTRCTQRVLDSINARSQSELEINYGQDV